MTKAYIDEETSQRGYLLTGDPVFRQPYHAGRIHAVALQARLRTLLAEDPQAQRILAQVIAAHQRWLTRAAEPQIAARQRGPIPAAALLPLALTGKRQFDKLRVQLARLQARTTALTTSQLNRIAESSSRSEIFRTKTSSVRSCSACCCTANKCWVSRPRWSS